MRISTAGMNNQMISQALRVQASYTEALQQQSSGLKSASLSGLDGNAGAAAGLTADIARSEKLSGIADAAASELEIAYSAVDSITEQVNGMLTDIAAAISGSADDTTLSTLQSSASDAFTDIVALLNTQYADTYVFSGGATATQPVDASLYDAADPTAYYQGSDSLRSVMLDGGASIAFGVTADAEAFSDTLEALNLLVSTSPLDTATMQQAYDLLSGAVSDLGTMMERLSAQTGKLDAVIDAQTDFQLYAGEMLDSLTTVDVATASAEASQREVLLEASFATLSSLKSISVLDYL